MTPREAFAVVDRCARDQEIDQLLVDLLRYPSPQTDQFESDPQIKRFISQPVASRLAELTGKPAMLDAMGNLIWRLGDTNKGGFLLVSDYHGTWAKEQFDEEIGRAHLLSPTGTAAGREVLWSHPAFANRCIYLRNDREIICASLAAGK